MSLETEPEHQKVYSNYPTNVPQIPIDEKNEHRKNIFASNDKEVARIEGALRHILVDKSDLSALTDSDKETHLSQVDGIIRSVSFLLRDEGITPPHIGNSGITLEVSEFVPPSGDFEAVIRPIFRLVDNNGSQIALPALSATYDDYARFPSVLANSIANHIEENKVRADEIYDTLIENANGLALGGITDPQTRSNVNKILHETVEILEDNGITWNQIDHLKIGLLPVYGESPQRIAIVFYDANGPAIVKADVGSEDTDSRSVATNLANGVLQSLNE